MSVSVGWGLRCGWGLDALAHSSATILWPRVTCFFNRVSAVHTFAYVCHKYFPSMVNAMHAILRLLNVWVHRKKGLWNTEKLGALRQRPVKHYSDVFHSQFPSKVINLHIWWRMAIKNMDDSFVCHTFSANGKVNDNQSTLCKYRKSSGNDLFYAHIRSYMIHELRREYCQPYNKVSTYIESMECRKKRNAR